MPASGQSVSEDAKQSMKATKQRKMSSKFQWELAEPYLDNPIDNGSANRVKPSVTLREFKEANQSGKSIKQLRNEGVSKHLLNFFSNFCQGKISLSKSEFEEDYLNGMSLDEIAEKYSISRGNLTYLRQLYEINRKGSKYIKRIANEQPLTDRQISIICGSLLGDAKKASNNSVAIDHGNPQKEYIDWFMYELNILCGNKSLYTWHYADHRNGSPRAKHTLSLKSHSDLEKPICLLYQNGKKSVPKEFLSEYINNLAVAVWYMDDGCVCNSHTLKKYKNATPSYQFCTDSFDYQSVYNICEWFYDTYNIKARIKERGLNKEGNMRYRVIIENESAQDFVDLICPHILPMFEYKLGNL